MTNVASDVLEVGRGLIYGRGVVYNLGAKVVNIGFEMWISVPAAECHGGDG